MKKLEDYLHLYIGCEYSTANSFGKVNTTTLPLILKYLPDYRDFKLHLRRLSSMTDDEVKDLFHFEKLVSIYREVSFERQMWNEVLTGITVSYLTGDDEDGWHPQSWTMEFSGMNSQDFVWFLKHGFDLFQLIDEGLAIDESTL